MNVPVEITLINLQNTYFARLSKEIILQILNKLEHFDILQFLEAFPEFSYEFRNLDLSMDYRIINFTQIISKNLIAPEHVTSLNINHLYWISAVDLRKFINKLINLKSLYAIQTKLDLTQDDVKMYNHIKVEKLAITSSYFIEANGKIPIPSVKVLYIRLNGEPDSVPHWIIANNKTPLKLTSLFPNLTKIWVEDQLFGYLLNLMDYLHKYEKVFILTVNCKEFDNVRRGKYFDSFRDNVHIICMDKLEGKEIFCQQHLLPYLAQNHATDALWSSVLKTSLHSIPFSPNDTRDIILKKVNLDNICLKDLNFVNYFQREHRDNHLKFSQSQREILSSKNAQTLRSLCLRDCVLTDDEEAEQNSENRALNSQISVQEIQPVKRLFDNLSNLEKLVVCSCSCVSIVKITGYNFINKCTNLRSLTIEIPQSCDGELFLPIFKECKFLETVKVDSQSFTQNEQFNNNLLKAIPMASNLKDFFFRNGSVPIEKFLTTLTQSRKLQRVALVSTEEFKKISFSMLKDFITSFPQPQLMFLLISIKNISKASINKFGRLFKGLTTHPAQTFVIENKAYGLDEKIPAVHIDLLYAETWAVASIDPSTDFLHF